MNNEEERLCTEGLELYVELSKYNYHDLVRLIFDLIKKGGVVRKVIRKVLLVSNEDQFVGLVGNSIVNGILCSLAEKFCEENFNIQKLCISRSDNHLILEMAVHNCKYGKLFDFISKKLERSKNKKIFLFVIPVLNILKTSFADEQNEKLLIDSINGLQEGLIEAIEHVAEKKNTELKIATIRCKKYMEEEMQIE